MLVNDRMGGELDLFAGLDHRTGEMFYFIHIERINVARGDECREFCRRNIVVHDILDDGERLFLGELVAVHLLFNKVQRLRPPCFTDLNLGTFFEMHPLVGDTVDTDCPLLCDG